MKRLIHAMLYCLIINKCTKFSFYFLLKCRWIKAIILLEHETFYLHIWKSSFFQLFLIVFGFDICINQILLLVLSRPSQYKRNSIHSRRTGNVLRQPLQNSNILLKSLQLQRNTPCITQTTKLLSLPSNLSVSCLKYKELILFKRGQVMTLTAISQARATKTKRQIDR